jgi:preprotein translocase subunit YajC
MFISTAYAQAASGSALGQGLGGLLPILLIIPVFYFLMIRPQQKKVKEHKALVSAVKRGDRVIAAGGIVGVVTKVIDDAEVQIEIAEGVRIRVLRGSINEVLNRAEPARTQDNSADKKNSAR